MSRSMFVNVVNEEESRIAIVSDGLLEELSIEASHHEQLEGNIYKAKIVKIVPSLEAVFVDYGGNRNGFLAASDIHTRYFPDTSRDIGQLKHGQELLVQVRKGEIGQKGAALTTYVSIPGRYFVLMPLVAKRGVSRKIQDEATRKQLRQVLDDAGFSEDVGFIVRTAAEGRTKQDIQRDASYLMRLWKRIQSQEQSTRAPALLYQDSDIVIRTLRDYFSPSIREVWVDDKEIFEQVQSFFQAVMPWHKRRVKLYQGKKPLFAKYDLEAQIASIHEKTVPLPSGGSIVIEQTEALVSIDVNSGKTTKGKDIEETAFIANREAAEEAVRQLRLRDLGGLVVIDFIDMRSSKHRNEIRKVLQKALKEDKARTDVGTISKFGLLELSRQRIKRSADVGATSPCPVCRGLGKVRSPESFALAILRMVQAELARHGEGTQVLVGVPTQVATLLLNRKRETISELEVDFRASIAIFGETALRPNQFFIEYREEGLHRIDTNLPDDFPRGLLAAPQGLPDVATRPQRPPSYALFDEEAEAPPEVPAEPPDEAEAPSREKPSRKRGRRRPKKKREEGEPQAAEGSAGGPTETTRREPEPPQATSPPAVAEATPERLGPAEEPQEVEERRLSASAKRRLRRKRKREREKTGVALVGGAAQEGPAPVGTPELNGEPGQAPGAEGTADASEPSQEASKPRRRSRRPRKKPPVQPEDEGPKPDAGPRTPDGASAAASPDQDPAALDAPSAPFGHTGPPEGPRAPRGSRRTRKKPAVPTPPGQSAETSSQGDGRASEGQETREESGLTEAPESKPEAPADRPRRRRSKARESSGEGSGEAPIASDEPAEKPTEEAPKPSRGTRRRRKKSGAPPASDPEGVGGGEPS